MTNHAEHYAEAERLLERADERIPVSDPPGYPPVPNGTESPDYRWTHREREVLVKAATAHAILALFGPVREIGDQLDAQKHFTMTDDDVMRCPHGAIICGLCGYGVPQGVQS